MTTSAPPETSVPLPREDARNSPRLGARDLFDLTGKVALLTGATRGIGLAIARAFAEAGAHVVVSSEDPQDAVRTAAMLHDEGFRALGIACDVTDDDAQMALVDATLAHFGHIDCLVCNAGVPGRPGPLGTSSMEDYDHVMGLDLRAMVVLTRRVLPQMAAIGGGSAVLMSSIAGLRGNGAIGAYALAKAGVAQLARNLAVEWGPRGIRVNAVSPGLIRTPMSAPLLRDDAFLARRLSMTPLRRVGEAEEVAGSVLFLASRAGGFISGHNLVVDGGTLVTDGS